MLHRLPVLWEFHRVHHSAKVLSPLTELRQHPVESIVVGATCAASYGLTLTAARLVWGSDLHLLAFWQPGVILFLLFATYTHLRHSHVRLGAPAWLSHLIQTPLQHQVHHSTDPRHFDRNLGFGLSLFDWMFGTLYIPGADEQLDFGLHDDAGAPDELMASARLIDHLWRPFVRAFAIAGRPAADAPAPPALPAE
jgi:sterol desaturase/sphingolipid hydroxylase (fatty acid hydroxylase superfamily)